MIKIQRSLPLIVTVVLAISLSACKSGNKKGNQDIDIEQFVSEEEIFDEIDNAKKIFYSLPSPLETAMLLKAAGAKFNEELLNSLSNTSNYTTNRAMALNLGIYTTDLSFASLFDQTQTSINYMNAARKMAEGLDISDAIDNETIKELEENLDKRDVVMDIISETFLNSSAYLKENDREDVATIVLVGGWIEGLYIATELVGDNEIDGNELVDRVLEQKLSFNILRRLLEQNKAKASGDVNEDIVNLMAELEPLKNAFDKVKIETTEPTVEQNPETNVSTIKSQTTVTVDPADFKEIQGVIAELRNSFIQ